MMKTHRHSQNAMARRRGGKALRPDATAQAVVPGPGIRKENVEHVQRRLDKWSAGVAELEVEYQKRRAKKHPFRDNGLGYCDHCGVRLPDLHDGRPIHSDRR